MYHTLKIPQFPWVRFRSHRGERIGERPLCVAAVGGIKLDSAGLGNVTGLLANHLQSPWWTAPHIGRQVTQIPAKTQSLLWSDGQNYHHLLPVCGSVFKTELCGDEQGLHIAVSAYDGGYSNFETVAFVLASGSDPFALPQQTAAGGLLALGKPPHTRERRTYPEPLEYLGWCSWDAFHYDIGADRLLEKATELNRAGVPVRWFIFDAGWSDAIEPYYLRSFGANPKFPQGLAPVIKRLKKRHGLRWVGVWHTIGGFWNGVHKDSLLAQEMRAALYETNSGKLIPSPEPDKGFHFWDAWHAQLKKQGVDFVKVDHQATLAHLYRYEQAIGKVAAGTHAALEKSVGKHFGNRMINCMGMASENIWHRPSSPVARNSDDFYPKENGFARHAMQNAYNAYYHGAFMWLDFDMWWTHHPDAVRHAVLRAISGGPVYVSDPIGATETGLLWPLILSDGRVLRCDQPGLPTEDCMLRDPTREAIPLKMWNRCGAAGLVAAFSVSRDGKRVTGAVGPRDVPGLAGEQFVVYEHFSRQARVLGRGETIEVSLADGQCALYVVVPAAGRHTPLGLIDKYISPATIAEQRTAGNKTTVTLKEGGLFAWVSSVLPAAAQVNGEPTAPETGAGIYTLDCSRLREEVRIEVE
jgi:hypothetical protein